MMEPLYKTYHMPAADASWLRCGNLFNGELIVALVDDAFDTLHSVPIYHCVVLTRTRGMDVIMKHGEGVEV